MDSLRVSLQPRRKRFEPTPRHSEGHDYLRVFLGEWSAEGRAQSGGNASGERMMHFHTYEWLPGNFHLYHCWEGKIGTHESKGVEIIGFDPATGTYPFHFFDSDGWARIYEGRVNGHLWTLSGTRERSTTVFSPDGLTMTTHWDRSPDGQVWEPLCDITANKVSNREAAFAVLQREPGLSE